jgi:FlaA1/EpsC-like NDP-sugar epimerase
LSSLEPKITNIPPGESSAVEVAGFAPRFPWMRVTQVVLDSILVALSLAGAYLIRFDGRIDPVYAAQLIKVIPVFVAMRILSNWSYGVYGRLWRYTGLTEVMELAVSVLTVSAVVL